MKWEAAKGSDTPKKGKGRGCLIAVAVVIVIAIIGGISRCGDGEKEEVHQLNWPDSGLATMLPEPGTDKGEVSMDSADYLSVDLEQRSEEDFNKYVEACKEKGFTVDYSSSSSSYYADNEDGYHLSLFYAESRDEISIQLSAPSEEEPEEAAPEESDSEKSETEETTPAQDSVPEEATPEQDAAPEESPQAEPETDGGTSASSDYRAMVDEWEAFMNKYCDFMETYNSDSGNVVSMALDYADMMSQYNDWAEKMDAVDDSDLSAEDVQYYIDAQSRINKRLLEIGADA